MRAFQTLKMLGIMLFALLIFQDGGPQPLAQAGEPPTSFANPAAVYCADLGYSYEIEETDLGQQGFCVFEDQSRCDAWEFLNGACGQERNLCARQGLATALRSDGKDMFSQTYAVCVDENEREVGSVSSMADLPQRAAEGCGAKPESPPPGYDLLQEAAPEATFHATALPASFDWRAQPAGNYLTNIRDQGICGSCWAFSAVGVAEAAYNIANNTAGDNYDLSEQYLVSDCHKYAGYQTCCGGWKHTALSYIKNSGIPDEACMPYVDGNDPGGCSCGSSCSPACRNNDADECSDRECRDRCGDYETRLVKINASGAVGSTANAIKTALVSKGPLAVSLRMNDGSFDANGVYHCSVDTPTNHAISIVGYDDAGGYWIARNSWGATWNGDGYFKVGYGECSIEKHVYYTTVTYPAAPLLNLPADGGQTIGTPTFFWNVVATAARYQFQYGTDALDPDTYVYRSGELSGTSHKPTAMDEMVPYYWFARARDAAGHWSDWSAPFSVMVVPPKPKAPALDIPASNSFTNDTTPELTWKSTLYAATYQVQVSTSSTFAGAPELEAGAATSYTPAALPDAKYYWRARARNLNNEYGPWSAARYFTVDTTPPAAPLLNLPANGSQPVGVPTFRWKAVPTAYRYQFQYGSDTLDPENYLYRTGELIGATHKPPDMPQMTPLYWFARAMDRAGNWSEWSAPFTVMVVPPKPKSPVLNTPATNYLTTDTTPELTWKSTLYAATYQVQIDDSSTFAAPLAQDTEGVTGLSLTADALPDGKYYWRARARNLNDEYGPWCLSRSFTVDITPPTAPLLNLPADGSQAVGVPTFRWKITPTAYLYQFQYGTDALDPGNYVYRSGELASALHKPSSMDMMVTYHWFARARDQAGNWSDWSAPYSVMVVPPVPAAPLLDSPPNGERKDSDMVNFWWKPVLYGNTYVIEVDDLSTFESPNFTYTSEPDIFHLKGGPFPTGKWFWRVKAVNTNNVSGRWSQVRFFKMYPGFTTHFNTPGDLEGWEPHFGLWGVNNGKLSTGGLEGDLTASASYGGATFTDFSYAVYMRMGFDDYRPVGDYNVHGLVVRGTPAFDSNNDWMNAYYFAIYQIKDEYYGNIACYTVYKIIDGVWTSQTGGYLNCPTELKFEDYNSFAVLASNNTIIFYIGSTHVWRNLMSGPTSGRLGVFTALSKSYEGISVDRASAGMPTWPLSAAAPDQLRIPIPEGAFPPDISR